MELEEAYHEVIGTIGEDDIEEVGYLHGILTESLAEVPHSKESIVLGYCSLKWLNSVIMGVSETFRVILS